MGPIRRHRPRHRRDWRRLWRYCRCGWRWRCPDSLDLVPMPYAPTVPPLDRASYRVAVTRGAPEPGTPGAPPPPVRRRARNERHALWNSPAGRHEIERAGALTPTRRHRARQAERA
ncbi:hypothetical protein ABGB07_30015 [Micromonosporaceae bacterium B7E4]